MSKVGIFLCCFQLASAGLFAANPDVLIAHVEITQTLQDGTNSVKLVRGKPTAIRVFPKTAAAGDLVTGVSARLHVYRGATELPNSPVEPDNQAKPVNDTVDRLDPDDSLNFTLDPDWYANDIDIQVDLIFPAGHIDPVLDNNVYPPSGKKRLSYEIRNAYRIAFLKVKYTNPAWTGTVDPRPRVATQTACDYLRSLFPVDPSELTYSEFAPGFITFSHGSSTGEIDADMLITELNTLWSAAPPASRPDRLFAWTPEGAYSSNGLSDPLWAGGQGHVSFGNDTEGRWRRTFAHETGHNTDSAGLMHTDRRLQNDEFGFDVLHIDPMNRVVMRKYPLGDSDGTLDLFDVMRGGEFEVHAWITPPYYLNLFNHFALPPADASSTSRRVIEIADNADESIKLPSHAADGEKGVGELREIQVVRGRVTRDGKGKFFPFYLIPATVDVSTRVPYEGTHEILFLGNGNELLKRIAWTPDFRTGDDPKDLLDSRAFTWNIEPLKGVRQVELRRQGNLLDVLRVRPMGPKIDGADMSETADNGDRILQWNVSAPSVPVDNSDVPQLTHQVFYSNDDGKSWRLAASGLQKPQWKMQTDGLPGGEKCLIQIRTTDGYNVDKRTLPLFAVEPKNAKVTITAPGEGKRYREGAGLLLIGQAVSSNEKIIDGSSLTWASDIQGNLGTGKKIVVRNLKMGVHKITLTAVDANGSESKSDPIEVTIEPSNSLRK